MDSARGALVPLAKGFRLRGIEARWGAVSCRGQMGEGTRIRALIESHPGKRRPVWTASSQKTGPKGVWRGLSDLSTIFNGSTPDFVIQATQGADVIVTTLVPTSPSTTTL